jgi:regulator of RNase E activity RraA
MISSSHGERQLDVGSSESTKRRLPAAILAEPLPIAGPGFARPDARIIRELHSASSATVSALLHRAGVRQTFIAGPQSRLPGSKVVGPVITLKFMPRREDIIWNLASGAEEEHVEKHSALWAVFEAVQPGDVLAVEAYGDLYTGCMGEMLITYFKGRGGAGIVVDGCIRDWPHVQSIGVPLWTVGFTPNYASQATLFPWAYNVPVALNRVLVMPGDIMIADDDGAVVVPAAMAEMIIERTREHEDWEDFSRQRLAEGGSIRTYYPLDEAGRREYEAWRRSKP